MKNQPIQPVNPVIKKATCSPLNFFLSSLLLAYALITVITPDLLALDSNGPRFLFLSFLNLLSWSYILASKKLKGESTLYWSFFRNKIGLAYSLFLVVVLISFVRAINMPEAFISFVKYFTVFFAVYIISIILRSDAGYFKMLIRVMVFLLVLDCFSVFYGILQYISERINTIYDIKSIYANKNILAAAIFIKIPFALWLTSFENGWLKKLGYFSLFCAILAVLFMSTRAFYLGLIILVITYSSFVLILDFRNKVVPVYKKLAQFIGIVVIAIFLFNVIQRYFYPKTSDSYNASSAQRLSSISVKDASSVERLLSWKRSAILFKENPLIGVGTGNWKVRILKYENPLTSNFSFMLKNHNDFLEIATETGILGGLLYLSLFVFLLLNFLWAFFKPGATENSFKYLFLPAFGIFCYGVDAFFNFPADRPEMQSLFALFLGAGIAFSPGSINQGRMINFRFTKMVTYIFILLLLSSSYILLLNFRSLKLQRIVQEDIAAGKLNHPSDLFIHGFPSVPDISILAEPISVNKSRYLINEGKCQDAINLLRNDKSNPWLSDREVYMAMAFARMGKNDSALVYAYKAYELKPLFFDNMNFICQTLIINGKPEDAIKMLEDYLLLEKNDSRVWLYLTSIYWKCGKYSKAVQTIDSAAVSRPLDIKILQEKQRLNRDLRIAPYYQIYSDAMKCLEQKNFQEAKKYLNEFIEKESEVGIVYAGRAYCYYYDKEYQKSINDIDRSVNLGNDTPDLMNLRGICYHMLGNDVAACKDFRNAVMRGDKDAAGNEKKYCKGG
jgi:putative inorganic carbon (hco3(-)) transporter